MLVTLERDLPMSARGRFFDLKVRPGKPVYAADFGEGSRDEAEDETGKYSGESAVRAMLW